MGNAGSRTPVLVIEPPHGWLRIDWRELVASRHLFWRLLARPIQVRYKQMVLGASWAILRPVVTMAIFSAFFGRLLKVPSDPGVPYPLFVYAGLLPWNFVAATVTGAASSSVSNSGLLTKVYFPRLLLPLSVAGYTLLDLGIASLVLVALMLGYGFAPSPWALLLPAVVLGIFACAMGVGILLSALTVKYRDFAYVTPFLVTMWMFVTPVIYPATVVPERFRWLASLNPMTGLITAFRSCLFGTPLAAGDLAVSCGSALMILAAGLWYFRQVEDEFADIV